MILLFTASNNNHIITKLKPMQQLKPAITSVMKKETKMLIFLNFDKLNKFVEAKTKNEEVSGRTPRHSSVIMEVLKSLYTKMVI